MPTYTFDPSLGTAKDRLRFRVGDTNGEPQWFIADETYEALASLYYEDEAEARSAETIGAICAQLSTRVIQRSLQIYYSDRAKDMFALATRIRDLAAPGPGDPVNYGALAGKVHGPDLREYEEMIGTRKRPYSCDPNADPYFQA